MDNHTRNIKEEEKRLYREYKEKLSVLKKKQKEQEQVGQVLAKGLLPIYVLYILSLGPTNGNDISHKIGERTKGFWIPSTGGIYPILKKLEKSNMVSGMWDDSNKKVQRIYTLTTKGIQELERKKSVLKVKIKESIEVFKIIYHDLYE